MVFPLYDDNRDRQKTPFITYALIALNVLVFLVPQGMGTNEKFTYAFATVPEEIVTGRDVDQPVPVQPPITQKEIGRIEHQRLPASLPVYITLLTSMFMHGGWAHLLGNMLFLWIFGDNVEDAVGHARYALFYVLGGVGAAAAQIFVDPASTLPMVGASGAIAAVLAAYFTLYPSSPITVLNPIAMAMPLLFFMGMPFTFELPAWVVVLYWFFFENLLQGLGSLLRAS